MLSPGRGVLRTVIVPLAAVVGAAAIPAQIDASRSVKAEQAEAAVRSPSGPWRRSRKWRQSNARCRTE